LLTLYTTPVIYLWFDRLSSRLGFGVPANGVAGAGTDAKSVGPEGSPGSPTDEVRE
jgi:hypothetical protein